MDVRILCYNICYGGYSGNIRKGEFQFERLRFEAISRVVKDAHADIVALVETYPAGRTKSPPTTLQQFDYLGYPFHGEGAPEDRRTGVSILSRLPISSFEDKSKIYFPHVRAHINVNTTDLVIDGIHPYPSPEVTEHDRRNFLGNIVMRRPTNHLIVGDLNSYDPHGRRTPQKLVTLFKNYCPTHNPEQTVKDLLSCGAYRVLAERGYADTYRAIHQRPNGKEYTIPTDLVDKDKGAAERIDYIWASPDIRVRDAGIIRGEDAERGSDHYPIFADLAINAL